MDIIGLRIYNDEERTRGKQTFLTRYSFRRAILSKGGEKMTQATDLHMGAMIAGMTIILLLAVFAVCILAIIAEWKLFKKAGEPGWAAIIPFYNVYVLTKITWGNGWLFLLTFLPIGNIVFLILTYIKLARVFGKGAGFAVGLIFLPYIFLLILAFGSSFYRGPDQSGSKTPVIICGVIGGIGILLLGVIFVAAVTMRITQVGDSSVYVQEDYGYEDDDFSDEDYEYDTDSSAGTEAEIEKTPVEGSEYFVSVVLDNGEGKVSVPVLDDEYMSVTDTGAYSLAEGITTSVYLGYEYGDVSQMVSDAVSTQCETLESLTEYYSDVTVDEMITGDGFALQQINYNYITWEGDSVPCFEIVKCDLTDGNVVMLNLTVDNSTATEKTQEVFEEACRLYGIDFQFD